MWDALHAEKAILTTMDITTDGFGEYSLPYLSSMFRFLVFCH